MNFREIKRKARRDLHAAMRVPAFYIEATGSQPIPIHVRVHTKFEEVGEISERDVGNATRHERVPSLIFMIDELRAAGIPWRQIPRNAVISVEAHEAYRIDNVLPPDDITVTAHVTMLPLYETINLPYPGSEGA